MCLTPYSCARFFHWQNTGAGLQAITTHIILQLRIYAMYGSSKIILAVCVFLTMAEALAIGIVFGIPKQGSVGELFKCVL
ncbi:hypothetical protein EW026_g4844 [Hermanssonia centrifuga]|uniref:Uncharacterized protein n=1 Tax=Hermanssonia centrifuga TaxID=98765 RepID=A0A4V3XA87_9APHY|nr:hypothetical protein EW026_g4844 [Hermanssonia centrifuga]